jgi:hypothetical protein
MDHWNKVEDAEINSYIMVNWFYPGCQDQ